MSNRGDGGDSAPKREALMYAAVPNDIVAMNRAA
jgi:hypothetical protein